MKKYILILFLILSFSNLFATQNPKIESGFPSKPIKIIVYTSPGGLIDVTTRKFTEIASKYSDATFVVENKPGAGGIVALQKVLSQPANGYTLFACTKSNISKFVSTGGTSYIHALDWLAMLMADPECVITNRKMEISDWTDIVKDAQKKNGEQIWVGPATGGLDHVTAIKIWEQFDFVSKWIPYKSGGKARAALLGKQGHAYVGNPREVLGNPDLKISAVSAKKRLEQFPDVPTFIELGSNELSNEYMWRGFAIKKGVPAEILNWYDKLFQQVNNDPNWRTFWEKGGIEVVYYGPEKFGTIVNSDAEFFRHYLGKIGIIKTENYNIFTRLGSRKGSAFLIVMLLLFNLIVGYFVYKSPKRELLSRILIISFFLSLSLLFYILSFVFPESGVVGPSVVPRLWIFLLIPLNLLLLIKTVSDKNIAEEHSGDVNKVLKFILFLAVYLVGIYFFGYYISSFVFVFMSMYMLGYRKFITMLIISFCWIIFSYLIFYRTLYVPLPIGRLFEILL
ncbi:MAG: tripartite tricarboxylate transporter substrate-binding protein [Candidatus Cloacimonadota bacterium]|nr:tripartite tricarboxylate transporter substrate-binding protein [Candidatus Cloacimonadota bacterium]